jgi:hypothetical protein
MSLVPADAMILGGVCASPGQYDTPRRVVRVASTFQICAPVTASNA